jgi:superfamily II DNA or RNA helicase
MPTFERRQKLLRLKEVGSCEIGLLSNARCLSEGVDVPALDGVAFIDAKSSEIDIIQAVGRAIRLSATHEEEEDADNVSILLLKGMGSPRRPHFLFPFLSTAFPLSPNEKPRLAGAQTIPI